MKNSQAQDPNLHIYLCFGQSNMEGQGAIAPEDLVADPRFQVLQAVDCTNRERTQGQWYEAIPPLCQCHSGLSPVHPFGRTLLAALPDSIRIGVVHVAVGGCDIRLFDKDLYTDYDSTYAEAWFTDKVAAYGGNPYAHMTQLAQQAQEEGVIKGILLHQGETNTGDTQWPEYVRKIYQDLLADLDLKAEEVPLLAGEMVSVEGSCCSSMNPIVNTLPEVIPTAHVISSAGCTAMDTAHFDAAGYRELGKRYARKMLALLRQE
ncbi:MAG: sialate O-acetylesterase [Bacteroidota bacterium]